MVTILPLCFLGRNTSRLLKGLLPPDMQPQICTQVRWPQSTISLLLTHFPLLLTHFPLPLTHFPLLLTHFPLLRTHFSLLRTHFFLLRTRTHGRRTFTTLRHEPPGPPLQAPCHGNIRTTLLGAGGGSLNQVLLGVLSVISLSF